MLDSLDAVGLRGDGRILQLNSYENRVFQVLLEDGRAVVAKFYRPGRWSDEQIVEEHAFALELAAAEVSVVPPLVLQAEPGVPGLVLHGDPPTLACHQRRRRHAPLCGRQSLRRPRARARRPGHAGAASAASSAACTRWVGAGPSCTGTTSTHAPTGSAP